MLPVKFAEVCTAIVCLLRPDVLSAGPSREGGGRGVTRVLITRLFSEKGLKKFLFAICNIILKRQSQMQCLLLSN